MITFVVPTYNNPTLLRNMLLSAKSTGNWPDEVIVVSDSSDKNAKESEVAYSMGCRHLFMPERSGFSKTVTEGCKRAKGDIIMLVNTDITFLFPILKEVEAEFATKKLGVLGFKLYTPNGNIQHGGGYYAWTEGQHYDWMQEETKGCVSNRVHYPAFVTGALYAFRKGVWKKLGFDQSLEFGCEDSDFCARNWANGYAVKYRPDLFALHAEGHSRDEWAEIKWAESKEKYAQKIIGWECDGTWIKVAKEMNKYKPKNDIIIERTGMKGDVVVLTKAVHAVKKAYPDRKIYVITNYPEVFKGNPDVEYAEQVIYGVDTPKYRINCANGIRPTLRMDKTHIENLKDYGLKVEAWEGPPLLYSEPRDVEMALRLAPIHPFAIIHQPVTNWANKTLPPLTWKKVQLGVKNLGLIPVIVGSKNDMGPMVEGAVDLRAKDNLHILYELIKLARVFIGVDSGPFHVAQATKTPCIVAFTCYDPACLILRDGVKAVVPKGCKFCFQRQKPPINWINCPDNKDYECAKTIDAQDFIKALEEIR